MPIRLSAAVCVAVLAAGGAAPLPTLAQDAAPVTFTAEQAQRGETSYRSNCVDCHGANLDDGEFGGPPLKGNAFREHWFGQTADGLYGFMSTAMPPDSPGRYSATQYADMLAYILKRNGFQAGGAELPSDSDTLYTLLMVK